MSKSPKHVHKYHKVNMFNNKVWACALPDCNHYMPRHMAEMIPGKASICWGCETDIVMNEENMRTDKPMCEECAPSIEAIANLLMNRVK